MGRSAVVVLLLLLLLGTPLSRGQCAEVAEEKQHSGATVEDLKRVRPLPPKNLTASIDDDRCEVVVSWRPSRAERVVAYQVYRRVGDGPFKPLSQVKDAVFIDRDAPSGDVEYAVAAVDLYENKSSLSKPVSKP